MTQQRVDRREFARRLAVGTGIAVAAPAVRADDPPRQPPMPQPPGEAPGDDPTFGPPPPHVLLVELIHQTYPHEKLTVDLLEKIEGEVRGQLARGSRLAEYPFTNADEPAPVFAAYRAEG